MTGGKIILDLYFFNDLEIGHKYQDFKVLPEKVILNNYIHQEDYLLCNRTFLFKDWISRNIELKWKIFSQNELESLAKETGFKIQNIYFDFDHKKVGTLEMQFNKTRRALVMEKLD